MQRFKAMSLWPVALRMSPFIFACWCILHTDVPPRRRNVNWWPPDSTELSVLGDWGAGGEEDQREGGSEYGWGASGLVGRGARWSSRCWSQEQNNCLALWNMLQRAEEVVWGGGGEEQEEGRATQEVDYTLYTCNVILDPLLIPPHPICGSSFPFFFSRSSLNLFFVCVWVSVLLSAKSLLCEYWHFQITQIEHFSRPRHAICTAKSSWSKSSCLIDLIPCVFAWTGSVTQSEAFLKTNFVWFATIMQPQIHVMNPAVSKITLNTNSIAKYQISLKNERGLSAI